MESGRPAQVPQSVAPSKRRRIAQACAVCRARKSRCDGAQPKCSNCQEWGCDCEYLRTGQSSKFMLGGEYVAALEQRLKSVESTIGAMRSHTFGGQNLLQSVSSMQERGLTGDEDDVGGIFQKSRRHGVVVHASDVQELAWNDDEATDGMGAITFAEEKDSGYFGPSSNVAFMRHVSHAIGHIYGLHTSPATHPSLQMDGRLMTASRPSSPSVASGQRREAIQAGPVNFYSLPPRAETRLLIKTYFSNTGLLFPYLHEPTFIETYDVMERNNFEQVRRTWLGLLNMVLALARSTAFDTDLGAQNRKAQSEMYYQRAHGLCSKQMMRGTSLEVVQYLLLMGQYLQGTQRSIQAWTTVGLAIRTAFQLGLQSSDASTDVSALEREVRTRTFYGCVVLDRQLSMTFGRPLAIPDQYVKLPMPQDYDNFAQATSPQDPWKQASVPFFNATMLMWKTIDLCYGGNLGCDKALGALELLPRIFQLEQELFDWKRTLPMDLKLRQSEDLPPEEADDHQYHLERLAIVLTLRYHNVRILLHRPILVKFLNACSRPETQNQELALLQQIGPNFLQICIESSMEIITLVKSIVRLTDLRRTILGSYWSSLYYTFNAALILFASFLVHQKGSVNIVFLSASGELIRESLREAAEVLPLLDQGNRVVTLCKERLEQLLHLLDTRVSSNEALPSLDGLGSVGTSASPQQVLGSDFAPSMMANPIDQSVLGLDFGEFMMEGELDFLNNLSTPNTTDKRYYRGVVQNQY